MSGRQSAIIKIPVNMEGIDVKTGDVHPIVMVNALQMLSKHFARELVKMAEKEVGKNQKLQEQWLDRMTKKHLGDNPNDIKFDPNAFN